MTARWNLYLPRINCWCIVSFRQACLKQFRDFATVVGFDFGEHNHGWTEAWRYSEVAGTWTRSF